MKPTRLQVIFAEDWLARIWVGGIVLSATIAMAAFFTPTFAVLGVSIASAGLILVILLTAAIAYFVSLVLGSCLLPPLYRARERVNGAPFETGDTVEVLRKPHRGKTALVVSPGHPQYGIFVSLSGDLKDPKPLNLAWHSVRKLTEAEHGGATDPKPDVELDSEGTLARERK